MQYLFIVFNTDKLCSIKIINAAKAVQNILYERINIKDYEPDKYRCYKKITVNPLSFILYVHIHIPVSVIYSAVDLLQLQVLYKRPRRSFALHRLA